MKPEMKAAWIAALRSGKYKQGWQALRSKDNRYCCLGVLCDLIDPHQWTSKTDEAGRYGYGYGDIWGGCYGIDVVPSYEAKEIGLDVSEQMALIDLNDTEEKDFQQIADWIEANL